MLCPSYICAFRILVSLRSNADVREKNPLLGSVTKNETYPPVGTFWGGWYVYMIFYDVISLRNLPTSRNVSTFRNKLSFVTHPWVDITDSPEERWVQIVITPCPGHRSEFLLVFQHRCTDICYKAGPRLRDLASWPPSGHGGSSHNLGHTLYRAPE